VSLLSNIRSIRDLELTGRTVFMRLDFNVPISGSGSSRKVDDDSRIQEALPTIRLALEKGARLVLASHLGRPDGKPNPEFSMEPVAVHLAGLLKTDVTLADDCVGEGIELMVKSLKNGQVLLLENLRFHPGEEANDSQFAGELARLAEVYVTDAFGTAHRKHASTYGVPAVMPFKGMGLLIEKELHSLDRLLHNPAKPFYALLGGSKVTDKIKTIESLLRQVDGLLIGGAMAHAFWAVQGDEIPSGAKHPKQGDIDAAREIMATAKRKDIPLLVPSDTNLGFDIGPRTVAKFTSFLTDAKTVFWNGPLGWFEKPEYAVGTFEVARALAAIPAFKVVGGGDTVSAIKQSGHASGFDHLSTGGGAVLEFLEQGTLPGIEILKTFPRQQQLNEMAPKR
jgi:phosphoglycerate kinase